MEQVLTIINTIATPDFMENYGFIVDPINLSKDKRRYSNLLDKWGLMREKQIALNIEELQKVSKINRRIERALNNPVFKTGEYNISRYEALTQR